LVNARNKNLSKISGISIMAFFNLRFQNIKQRMSTIIKGDYGFGPKIWSIEFYALET